MNKWTQRLGPLTRAVAAISGGVAIAQLLNFAAYPILTRIFSDADFGVLGVYQAIVSVVVTVAALRFDQAIPLPKAKRTSVALVVLSGAMTVTASLITLIVLMAWPGAVALVSERELPRTILYLIPLGILLGAAYQVATMWGVRNRAYKSIAKTKITQAVVAVATQLSAGLASVGAIGLVAGQAMGSGAGTLSLMARTFPWNELKTVRLKELAVAFKRYRNFALLGAPAALLNATAVNLPPLALGAFYGLGTVGLFAVTAKVVSIPAQLVGVSMGQVFFGEAGRIGKANPLKILALVDRFIKTASLFALVPALILAFLGPTLFSLIFGESWRQAGVFAQPMAFFLVAQLIANPISGIFLVLERQDLSVIFNIAKLALAFLAFALPSWLGADASIAIWCYSLALTFYYAMVVVAARILLKHEVRREKR